MTNEDLVKYYANLLILQYRQKPKAYATVRETIRPIIMEQLPAAVNSAFNVGTAVGAQLDVLAKYVGVSRTGYDLQNNPVTLSDDDLRSLVRLKIGLNSTSSSLSNIQDFLNTYFPGVVQIFDYENMHISYFYEVALGTNIFAEFFFKQGYLPKPLGVLTASLILAPIANQYFGLRTYEFAAYQSTPANDYTGGFVNGPWLSYTQAITI